MDSEKVIKGLYDIGEFVAERIGIEQARDFIRTIDDAISLLKEQEAKNGEWITIWREDDPDTSSHARCSVCNRVSERPLGEYCKWCGTKMNQEWGVDG